MAKEYTIIQHRERYNGTKVTEITGTLDYLINQYFGYTLEVGRSWQHERGNHKIPENDRIRSGKTLVTALNNSETNRAQNGWSGTWYELKEA